MSIIVLLSPIHFFSIFPSLNYHLQNANYFILNSKGDNSYLPLQKTNNFKIHVALTEFFIRWKFAKILFLHKSLFINQLEILSHVNRKCITQVLPWEYYSPFSSGFYKLKDNKTSDWLLERMYLPI